MMAREKYVIVYMVAGDMAEAIPYLVLDSFQNLGRI